MNKSRKTNLRILIKDNGKGSLMLDCNGTIAPELIPQAIAYVEKIKSELEIQMGSALLEAVARTSP